MHVFKMIDGVEVPLTPAEIAALDTKDADPAAHAFAPDPDCPGLERHRHNAPILAAIAELDSKRLRPSAEMALAFANGVGPDPADVARLNALTAEIAALRAGLMP